MLRTDGSRNTHAVLAFTAVATSLDIKCPSDVLLSVTVRDVGTTVAVPSTTHRMKLPLSDFFGLDGFSPHFDWNYELLHGILLGIIKYLWQNICKDDTVKRHMPTLALIMQASNLDNLHHRLSPNQILSRPNGKDFRLLGSIWPFVMLSHITALESFHVDFPNLQQLFNLWWTVSSLSKLLFQPEIRNLEACIESVTNTSHKLVHMWSNMWGIDTISRKGKFHQLAHIPLWARRFGPPLCAIAEPNERLNKTLRKQFSLTNRQACSRDIAMKHALNAGLQHMMQGGYYVDIEKQVFTRAGSFVLELGENPIVQKMLGIGRPHTVHITAEHLQEVERAVLDKCFWSSFNRSNSKVLSLITHSKYVIDFRSIRLQTITSSVAVLGHSLSGKTTWVRLNKYSVERIAVGSCSLSTRWSNCHGHLEMLPSKPQ